MGYRLKIPNQPDLIYVFDLALNNPLKTIEINNPSVMRRLGYYADSLISQGVLDILYNKRKRTTSLVIKTDSFKKRKFNHNTYEYVLGDKINNALKIPEININMPEIEL